MKFIAASDLHIHDRRPENRVGDYLSHVLDKFEQILKITKEEKAILLIAGDVLDSPSVSYKVVTELVALLNKYQVQIYAIPGQHDLRYHVSGLRNTPLGLLYETGLIHDGTLPSCTKLGFIGAAWGEEPKAKADILFIHRMVTEDGPLWSNQDNFISSRELLNQYKWAKVIISGDNHLPHCIQYQNKFQLNCGSMMRSSKDQINHKPSVWKIEIEKEISIKRMYLKVEPVDKVFDLEKIQKSDLQKEISEEAKEKMEAFINTLPKQDQEKPNFKNSLNIVIQNTKPKEKIKNLINSIMEKCQSKGA